MQGSFWHAPLTSAAVAVAGQILGQRLESHVDITIVLERETIDK